MLITMLVAIMGVGTKKIILTLIFLKPITIFNKGFAYIKKNSCNLLLLRVIIIFVGTFKLLCFVIFDVFQILYFQLPVYKRTLEVV